MPKAGGEYKPRTKTDAPARLTLALGWTLWQKPPAYWQGCGSSVVEHSLGKGEVESSILSRSTIISETLQTKTLVALGINVLIRH